MVKKTTNYSKYSKELTVAAICGVVVIVGVLMVAYASDSFRFSLSRSSADENQSTATVVLDFGADERRSFEGPITAHMSILQALYAAAEAGGLPIVYYVNEEDIVSLISIDKRVEGVANTYWRVYRNGEPINPESIASVYISHGDVITFSFEAQQ